MVGRWGGLGDEERPPSPSRQSAALASRLALLAGRSSPDAERAARADLDLGLATRAQAQEELVAGRGDEVEILQEDISVQVLQHNRPLDIIELGEEDEEAIEVVPIENVEIGVNDQAENVDIVGDPADDDPDIEGPSNSTPGAGPSNVASGSTSEAGPSGRPSLLLPPPCAAAACSSRPWQRSGKQLPWGRGRHGDDPSSEEEEEEEEELVRLNRSQAPDPLHVSPTASSVPALRPSAPNFDQRRFLRELSRPGDVQEEQPGPLLTPPAPRVHSDRRIRLARDLLRSLTEPSPPPPPYPGLPSPPSPPVPSIYSPVQGLHLSRPNPSPRYEPPHTTEVGNRIDRILELSRRTRSLAEVLERGGGSASTSHSGTSIPRDEQLAQAAESAADVRRVLRAGRGIVGEGASGSGQPTPTRGREPEQPRQDDLDLEERPRADDAQPTFKRARRDDHGGQYAADIEEAMRRSLREQGQEPATPRPGCSHWDAPTPAEAPATATPSTASEAPDFEAQYNALFASHRRLVENLQSSLECPVCMETIREAPVPCCRSGHLICSVCVQRTFLCPTCRAPMSLASGQRCVSHSANRLIDLLPHPCINRDAGCQVEDLLAQLRVHEQSCRFRQVRCPHHHCPASCPLASLQEHLACHPPPSHPPPLPGTQGQPLTLHRHLTHPPALPGETAAFRLRSLEPLRFLHGEQTFYLQTIASRDARHLYSFVQAEGTRAECAKYWVTITIASFNPGHSAQVCQTLRPTPLDLHCYDDLLSIGDAVVLTERTVISMLTYDEERKRYQFKVEVEVRDENGEEVKNERL